MTLKERKQTIEQNVEYGIKKSTGENVQVMASYNIESGVLSVALVEQHMDQEHGVLQGIVNYVIQYNENSDTVSIYAFSRKYLYDGLGVQTVVTDPVYVDEGFISSIKDLIKFGMSDNFSVDAFRDSDGTGAEGEHIEGEHVEKVEAEVVSE